MPSAPRALAVALILLAVAFTPLVAAQDERLVSQSLWGVKHATGLNVVREFLTNYGDRSFWEERPSGQGVRVAVIDTGLDPNHPDLQDTLACQACWRDLVDGREEPYDDHGHGTHVAGIIAGRGHLQVNPLNSYFPTGARGLAPGAGLLVAKAMNATGSGEDSTVAQAVRWAMDPDGDPSTPNGAHIIHLSLGIEAPSRGPGGGMPVLEQGSETEAAVTEAIDRGIFVVMSAGNQGKQGPAPPGDVEGVIAVGALDANRQVLSFSNRGPGVDLYAPAVITSSWPEALDDDGIQDGYTGLAGTSQAAPVVTGALALALEANPALASGGGATKVAHIEYLLVETGTPVEGEPAGVVALDAHALIASQDRGADGVAWGVVIGVALVAGLVVFLVARLVLVYLRRHAEARGEKGSQEGSHGGPAPSPSQAEGQSRGSRTTSDNGGGAGGNGSGVVFTPDEGKEPE